MTNYKGVSVYAALFLLATVTLAFPLGPPLYGASSNITIHVFRLRPGANLLQGLMQVVMDRNLTAASIVSAVGSLTTAGVRFANQPNVTILSGHFEIVSLSGMLSSMPAPPDEPADVHIHISLGRTDGTTVSGHFESGTIYTTAEIALASYNDLIFRRQLDKTFGYYELTIEPRY